MKLSELFFYGGRLHSRYPLIVLIFSVLLLGIALVGVFQVNITSDPIDLWVSPNSKLNEIRKQKIQIFDEDFRIESLFLKPKDHSVLDNEDYDIINKENLKQIYYLELLLKNGPYQQAQKNDFQKLCWTAFTNGDCITQSPMNFWQGNLKRMLEDKDIKETIACEKSVDPSSQMTCMDEHQLPVIANAVFGGITKHKLNGMNCKSNDDDDPCQRYRIKAKTLLINYLLKGDQKLVSKAEFWEQNLAEKYIEEFNQSKSTGFIKKYIKDQEIEDIPITLEITYMLQRTINDELKKESQQNFFIVIVSYSIMFIYIALSLGKFYSLVQSNFLLTLSGLFYIIAAVVIGFGLCGFFGMKISLITLEVIPFLILAIGVDNMFLIYFSIYKVPSNDADLKVAVGLRNIGTSIVLSTFTQILTFFCGYSIGIPALTTFCFCSMCCLSANFLCQMTVWPALVSIDLKRKQQGFVDLIPCLKTQNKTDIKFIQTNWSSNFFDKYWRPFILHKLCKVITFIICIGFLVLSYFALQNIPEGLDQQLATIQDGNLYNYFGNVKKYIEQGPEASLLILNADYNNDDTYTMIDELIELLSQREGLAQNPWLNWHKGIQTIQNMIFDRIFVDKCFKGVNPDKLLSDINLLVDYYLKIGRDHPCCLNYGVCGGQFYNDVVFKNQQISSTKINYFIGKLREQSDYIRVLRETHQIVDYFKEKNKLKLEEINLEIQPYSFWFVFFEQYETIKGLTIQNYFLSIMILLCLVSILYDWVIAVIMVVIVLFISSNLWSLIWICNFIFVGLPVEINGVLLVNFILSIGLSVEFCIHTIVRYKKAKGDHEMKIKKTIKERISIVFQGIFLTKLIGLSVLYFSPIPMFVIYYFRVFYAMILICGFYGLIVVPQILDIFGHYISKQKVSKKSLNDYILQNVKDKEEIIDAIQ